MNAGGAEGKATLRLDDYLPYRLSITAEAVSRLIASAYVIEFGLRVPEWRVLAVLAQAPGQTQAALVARIRMDKVTISRAVQGLIGRELVRRAPNPQDGRSQTLDMTNRGRRLFARVAPLALGFEAALLDAFTPAEVATVTTLLERLQARADALFEERSQPPSERADAGGAGA